MKTIANLGVRASYVCSLEHLSDGELLVGTRRLVGRSNQLLAELLAHLGEVEARGIHRTRACSSLYAYCMYELRFSEDEAFRRVAAARLVRRFPPLLDALATGELHLTGLLLLGPHLTPDNLVEVLVRAKHRSKREVARLVRILDPLPAVPARIEPLGPALARLAPAAPTWEEFVHATRPVRELNPGERPRDWMEGANASDPTCPAEGGIGNSAAVGSAPARVNSDDVAPATPARVNSDDVAPAGVDDVAPARVEWSVTTSVRTGPADSATAPATGDAPARLGVLGAERRAADRYKVQFTATEEYVRLVEQAKALLSHVNPRLTFEELQLRAMRALVAGLSKRKFGMLDGSPAAVRARLAEAGEQEPQEGQRAQLSAERENARASDESRCGACPDERHPERAEQKDGRKPERAEQKDGRKPERAEQENGRKPERAEQENGRKPERAEQEDARHLKRVELTIVRHSTRADGCPPRGRGRHISAAARRAVFERDGHRCSYVAATGERCCETHHLQFHHLEPFASGGDDSVENLALRCAAHNALAAEEAFGRDFMESKLGPGRSRLE